MSLSIVLVGNPGGTNVGTSLYHAAVALGHSVTFVDATRAFNAPRWLSRLTWRFWDHRPPRLREVSREIVMLCKQTCPDVVVAAGNIPLVAEDVERIRQLGISTSVFLTDDPWNPTATTKWFLKALRCYDKVFTPRHATVEDLNNIGCGDVRYLPFGYDPDLFFASSTPPRDNTIVFIGGADQDRVTLLTPLLKSGLPVALYGDYWERTSITRPFAKGHVPPDQLRTITQNALVNVCLVRRANRDEHVMRSFEIPACQGVMVAEDTADHRTFLGTDGDTVLYFRDEYELVEQCRWMVTHPKERTQMRHNVYQRIVTGKHTYQDRLLSLLS